MTDSLRVCYQFGDGYVRVGDVERDHALDALGKHYAAGRLSAEEFEERISTALRARTRSDLWALFHDLPSNRATWPSVPGARPDFWRLAGRVLTVAVATALVLGVMVALLLVVLVTTMMAFSGLVWLVLLWWLLAASTRRGYRRHACRVYRRQAYWPTRGSATWL